MTGLSPSTSPCASQVRSAARSIGPISLPSPSLTLNPAMRRRIYTFSDPTQANTRTPFFPAFAQVLRNKGLAGSSIMAWSRWPTSMRRPCGWGDSAATPAGTWSARFVLDPGPAADAALDHIEELAVCMGRAGGLEGDDAVYVGVALREAVVNAFRHGHSPDGAPTRIGLHLTPDSLVITVRDRGPGFDPDAVPDPCADQPRPRQRPRPALHALLHRPGFFRFPEAGWLGRAAREEDATLAGASAASTGSDASAGCHGRQPASSGLPAPARFT